VEANRLRWRWSSELEVTDWMRSVVFIEVRVNIKKYRRVSGNERLTRSTPKCAGFMFSRSKSLRELLKT